MHHAPDRRPERRGLPAREAAGNARDGRASWWFDEAITITFDNLIRTERRLRGHPCAQGKVLCFGFDRAQGTAETIRAIFANSVLVRTEKARQEGRHFAASGKVLELREARSLRRTVGVQGSLLHSVVRGGGL